MAHAIVQPKPKWTVGASTLAVAVVFGYLISNCFTALNVQLLPLEVQSMISATDLSTVSNFSNSELAAGTTNATNTVSEATPSNPITNTVLRNLILPPVPPGSALCTGTSSNNRGAESETETSLQLNFPQRAWQERVLSTALKPKKQLRIVVNPSTPSASQTIKISDLPMNASLAADLVIYSTLLSSWFPSKNRQAFIDYSAFNQQYANEMKPKTKFTDSAARTYGLLPRDERDEPAQRAFLLKASAASIFRVFNATVNTSRSDIVAEFSHVTISPSLAFDALTIEFALDPLLFKDTFTFANRTRYTRLDQNLQCGSQSGKCLIPKPRFSTLDSQFDPPPQVYAFQMCGTAEGLELLNATFDNSTGIWSSDCSHGSNSSILLVSLGKRLEADALHQNMTVSVTSRPSIKEPTGDNRPEYAVATNLRKVYSLTVGRLAWQDVDLAEEFNAKCGVDKDGTGCRGLTLPLAPPLATDPTTSTEQLLVVGIDAIPTGQLNRAERFEFIDPGKRLLVSVNEPRPAKDISYDIRSGDVLFPHNVGNFSWDVDYQNVAGDCDEQAEIRIQQRLDNHHYIERSLQPAYTTGVLFLLQNAVMKDVVKLRTDHQTLDFDGNSQRITVWISTPTLNAWLTYAGCLLIAIALLATIVIARAILADAQFPPLLVKRCIVDENDVASQVAIDSYIVDSLTLNLDPESKDAKPATGQTPPADVV